VLTGMQSAGTIWGLAEIRRSELLGLVLRGVFGVGKGWFWDMIMSGRFKSLGYQALFALSRRDEIFRIFHESHRKMIS
jgi:hypothetical protein